MSSEAWWATLYDEHLAALLLERSSPEDVARTLDFLVERMDVRPGHRVFDQCCGTGSLAVPLAHRGLRVVGWDLIEGYVAQAQARARREGVEVEIFCSDAFEVSVAPCRAGFNWWTSFGYAPDDATNERMLHRAFESLEPGGVYVLDFMNVPGVLRGFQPHVVTRGPTADGELILLRESSVDLERGVLRKTWTYFLSDGQRIEHPSEVRLYNPWDIRAALIRVGFRSVELLGDLDGRPLSLDAPRCIAVARKGDS